MRFFGFVLLGLGAVFTFWRPRRELAVQLTPERLYSFALHDKQTEYLHG